MKAIIVKYGPVVAREIAKAIKDYVIAHHSNWLAQRWRERAIIAYIEANVKEGDDFKIDGDRYCGQCGNPECLCQEGGA
jgi:hypothetical protein